MAKKLFGSFRGLDLAQRRELLVAEEQAQKLGKSDAIRAAMETHTKLAIPYTRKRDGQTVDRVIAPYEVKPHPANGRLVLYATDNLHGAAQIHSFYMSRMGTPENLTRAGFDPRWPTRPESV